jgi:membrane-associated protease RseP (regulator of RpoE activity)
VDILLLPAFWLEVLLGPSLGVAALTVGIFLHELGHVAVARYYGLQVTHFHVRPWAGHCSFADDARSDEVYDNPFQRGLLYAGGSLANLLATIVFLVLAQFDSTTGLHFHLWLLAAANGLLALQLVLCAKVMGSDGAEVLDAWHEYRDSRQLKGT